MSDTTTITVPTSRRYDVLVGRDLLAELPQLLGEGVQRVAVIHPEALRRTGQAIRAGLAKEDFQAYAVEVPDGEQAKQASVASHCWQVLGEHGFTRSDAIVGVGGGATTDVAGFVAATWLRGVRVVHVPTTVLGMVDAAVGGKTGVNTAEGKNLVGAFHEPAGVLCDLSTLQTLPRQEMVNGLAEVLKCGFIADPQILDLVEGDPQRATDYHSALLRELVERAVRVKAGIVAGDLRETTSAGGRVGREALNYGHTFGHAVERVEGYRYPHGAAVAVGMVYVAELARLAGRLDETIAERHRTVLAGVGLPTAYRAGSWDGIYDAMRLDKKARGDRLRFVVLDGLARTGILEAPEPALLTAAYAEVAR
ncbi:MAG: 3-dehydroquinate synthase [Nocardioidaceae bacterium]